MAQHSTLIATLFVAFISLCSGHPFSKHRNPVSQYFNVSPMKNALDQEVVARRSVGSLLSHFNEVGDEMRRLRNISYVNTGLQGICNVVDPKLTPHRVALRLWMFGFSHFLSKCITDLKIGDEHRLRRDIMWLHWSLERRRKDILLHSVTGWNNAYFPLKYNYTSFTQYCGLHYMTALRVNSSWVLLASMTRDASTSNSKNKTQRYIEELIKGNKNGLQNVHLNNGENANASSVESTWGGKRSGPVFGALRNSIEDNPAIKAVLSSNSRWSAQVESSFNIANIATMTISCLLAFIPLSCFHETKPYALFFYVLFTDIVACAPLAIKGIELIYFTNQFHSAVRTRVYGLDYELDLGVAEVWVAHCSALSNVPWMGVKFVMFAFSSMLAGIGIEVFMIKMRRRRKKQEESGRPPDRWWEVDTACTVCFCRHLISFEGSRGVYISRGRLFSMPSQKLAVLSAIP